MSERKLLQYGWISGPVECCCSECDWTSTFVAVDTSIPAELLAEFQRHDCKQHAMPALEVHPLTQQLG